MSAGYRRSFERYELKYVVDHRVAAALRERVAPFMSPDPHNGARGFYPVVSLYYDSADLSAYWEKVEGLRFRRKLRVRRYPEAGPEAFLEIKERADRAVRKRRRRAPLDALLAFLAAGGEHPLGEALGVVGEEAAEMVQRLGLKPRLLTLYNREAWFGRYEEGLRLTFDRNLRQRRFLGEFAHDLLADPFLLPPSQVVVELKCNEQLPAWLSACLASLDLELRRLSKYCEAVRRQFPLAVG